MPCHQASHTAQPPQPASQSPCTHTLPQQFPFQVRLCVVKNVFHHKIWVSADSPDLMSLDTSEHSGAGLTDDLQQHLANNGPSSNYVCGSCASQSSGHHCGVAHVLLTSLCFHFSRVLSVLLRFSLCSLVFYSSVLTFASHLDRPTHHVHSRELFTACDVSVHCCDWSPQSLEHRVANMWLLNRDVANYPSCLFRCGRRVRTYVCPWVKHFTNLGVNE